MKPGMIVLIVSAILVGAGLWLIFKSAPACKGSCSSPYGCKGNSTTRNQDLSFAGGMPTNYDYYRY